MGLTTPRPQPREKSSQKFLSDKLLMAHWADRAHGSRAEPVPSQQRLEPGFPRAKSHLLPGKGGNHWQEVIQAMSRGPSPGQCWGAGWDPLPCECCRAGRLSPWEEGQGNLVRIDKGSHPLRRVGSHLTHQDLQSWPTYLGTKESW